MPARLLVILGAGASFDCRTDAIPDVNPELRPPLVTDLFAPRRAFTEILHQYPLAEQAAADIRHALTNGSVALEAFLRDELRDSPHEHRRRQYWSVPLYLQHLLFNVSVWNGRGGGQGYTAHPDVYDRLVNGALRVPEVTFVTLNYDTILDQRLFVHTREKTLGTYIATDRNWTLVKLHGSIDWGRRVLNAPSPVRVTDPVLNNAFAILGDEIELSNDITLRHGIDVAQLRGVTRGVVPVEGANGAAIYYPALSAPLGAEDEIVCPPEHVEHFKAIRGHWDPVDVLVIGYSGLDQGVLDLLAWGGRPIQSLMVVSETESNSRQTADRITNRVRVADIVFGERPAMVSTGFKVFVEGGDFDLYINEILHRASERDALEEKRPGRSSN